MDEQLVPASTENVFYESHMLELLTENSSKAYSYNELSVCLHMSRKMAKNVARRLKRKGCVIIKPMVGQRRIICGFAVGKDNVKRPAFKDKDMPIAYVMINKNWLGEHPPVLPAVQEGG